MDTETVLFETLPSIEIPASCPDCGQVGSPRDGQHWQIVGGSFADVTALTLSPSIAKNCCGWHGCLRNGVFEIC